ncbi:hypothetical protein BN1095_4380001 [Clostridioides difficile]|uniref:Uncharacterized protein n=1 Tax=Clostridioides difficile TaxID=1496 RepID=A0A069AWT3_CLODI|nr:hypothetical protein BN1095_4380001 [Clostridioides difficile]
MNAVFAAFAERRVSRNVAMPSEGCSDGIAVNPLLHTDDGD